MSNTVDSKDPVQVFKHGTNILICIYTISAFREIV